MPLVHLNNTYFAFSATGDKRLWQLVNATSSTAKLYSITATGKQFLAQVAITNGGITLDIKAGQAILVELV